MKKIISFVLSMVFVLGLAACGTGNSGVTPAPSQKQSEGQSTSTELPKETKEPAKAVMEETVTEQTLVDEKGIKITAKGLEKDGIFGAELKLLVENNSDTDLTVQSRNSSVNGYMVETMMSTDVAAGKKANDSMTFSSTDLQMCGINSFADFEFSFHIFTTEGWNDFLDTPIIKVSTSVADTYSYTYDDSGDVIYEGNNIRIISKGLSKEDSLFGKDLILYIENLSDEAITVQARDVSVNGFMVSTTMSEDVSSGKRANTALTIMQLSLEENEISEITDIELSFHIFKADGWDTIADSDKITLNFN